MQRFGILVVLIVFIINSGFAQSNIGSGKLAAKKGIEITTATSPISEKENAPEVEPYDLFWDRGAEGKLIFFQEDFIVRDTVCMELEESGSEETEMISFPREMVIRIKEELKENPYCRIYYYSGSSQEWPNRVSKKEFDNVVQLILCLITMEGISRDQLTWHLLHSENGYWTMRFPVEFQTVKNRGVPGFVLWFE